MRSDENLFVLRIKKGTIIAFALVLISVLGAVLFLNKDKLSVGAQENCGSGKKLIKYVEFNPTFEALDKAMKADIKSQGTEVKINWIEVLAYLGAKYGGDFKKYKDSDMDDVIEKLKNGTAMPEITKSMKNYNYYNEAYSAVLQEFLGSYKIQKGPKNEGEEAAWEEIYGLKVFSPIARTFPYCHFDDFGSARSYGFSRPHLGHDMMCAVGTPVIAVESGTVEIMGWNQYGGWRVGIRSFDKKRYYYYAHLRQNRPFHVDLIEGKVVKAGDVIGYVGRTGYSKEENVNNIKTSHLHIGLQLIFDESQKECDNEIWVDFYALSKMLEKNKSAVVRNAETKEYYREFDFSEPNLEK